ncbi:cyclic nucleotide-binding domain-containing protein [bacterium]|nr:cyclic nucleotide-binding domain-containing protein [bacterium]
MSKSTDIEWMPLRKKGDLSQKEIREIFSRSTLFGDVPKRYWKMISDMLHIRSYGEGEVIFESGTPGLGMYVILDGEVKILASAEEDARELVRLHTGDFFGEMSLIDELTRSATALTCKPTLLAGFFRPQLQHLMHQRPRIGVFIMERLAKITFQRLRMANEKLVEYREQNQEEAE